MRPGRLIETRAVALAEIDATARLRPVSETALEGLVASIETLGHIKDPVDLRRRTDGSLVLIAGGHRVAAAVRLGWESLPAKIWDCTVAWASLLEVDDNLAQAELSPLDMAVFFAERKRVYEEQFPETRAAAFKGNRHTGKLASDTMSFTTTIAEKRGISRRQVERIAAAGSALTSDQRRWLYDAPKPPTLADLTALAREGEERIRTQAILEFTRGDARRIKDAIKAGKGIASPTVKDPVEEAYSALRRLWSRAPARARRRFVDECAQDLARLLDDRSGGHPE